MTCYNPGCLGNYDFEHIADFARQRFIDGVSTIDLMAQAQSAIEKEEIALVCLLDVDDDVVQDLMLSCVHDDTCEVTNCRTKLKNMIEDELSEHPS